MGFPSILSYGHRQKYIIKLICFKNKKILDQKFVTSVYDS